MTRLNVLVLSFFFFINHSFKSRINEKETLLHKTTVWEEKEDSIFAYFVYGLHVTSKSSILAFAEARITTGADDSAHHIVMKRSTDKGVSFSKSQVVVESKGGQSWANPTVVQNRKTKEIFLFYALNYENKHTEVFYKVSKDDGLNWSEAKSITSLFENNLNGWTFHLPGPGHGIQLKNGRLVIPIWHRKSITFPAAQRNYGVNCIYSDDHGKSWKVGGDTPIGELNESQLVSQQNGDLLLIGRTLNPKAGAYQAKVWSKDGGVTWSRVLQYDTALTGKVCDIGLTNYSPTTYLISQPVDPTQRKDLSIRMSKDEGKTWPIARLLEAGGATYSDLAVLPDKSIICLYGHGGRKHMPQKVSLARFNMEWLLEKRNND
ncbi:sialidase family protein [Pedobacter frigiditerrae]|uniref:sialidase family protein n=1 Tax=Pedobacter frigiditerrae TaxID=2530452 RepID=UPI00292FC40D|nr:sialidase family protein [Pedobacter frigiditerrae]